MDPTKLLAVILKGLRLTLKFVLLVFIEMLNVKEKKHEPTTQELICGEKIPFSDKYFIPDEKYKTK